jgi:hypothetical protein
MPSVWIERRQTSSGRTRYVVKYRLGGRESSPSLRGLVRGEARRARKT